MENSNVFMGEFAFENVVCQLATILFKPVCVNVLSYNLAVSLKLFSTG